MTRARRWLAIAVGAIALAGCTEEPASRRDDAILTDGKALYSQRDEELIISHFFQDRTGGFFVDVGAWQWQKASTTYYLEAHLGWAGIAIDALPWLAAGYEENRSRTRFFNYIVTDHSGTVEKFFAAGPLSSTSEDHIKQFEPLGEITMREIEVPTITLDELLDGAGVRRIDFLSMDIEGGEVEALAGFDLEHFRPKLVCIEIAQKNRETVSRYFAERGYERIERYLDYDMVNWYFTPSLSR